MGGLGSGLKNGKACVEDRLSIDIRQWQRENWLSPGTAFDITWKRSGKIISSIGVTVDQEQVEVNYQATINGEPQVIIYQVKLARQAVHFGGYRYWFLCPACQRKVALLYYDHGVFACRHCHNLGYRVQREQSYQQAIRKAEKLRKKLKWSDCILSCPGDKPKWMHQRTFERLQQETLKCTVQSMKGAIVRYSAF